MDVYPAQSTPNATPALAEAGELVREAASDCQGLTSEQRISQLPGPSPRTQGGQCGTIAYGPHPHQAAMVRALLPQGPGTVCMRKHASILSG